MVNPFDPQPANERFFGILISGFFYLKFFRKNNTNI